MRRGDEVDVVAAGGPQADHDAGQALGRDFLAAHLVADIVVLAEQATEVAAGEEDRAGAATADEWRLFAKVRAVAGDAGEVAALAVARRTGSAVNVAGAGTERTGGQQAAGRA